MSENIIVRRYDLDDLLNNKKVEGYELVENNIVCEDINDGVFSFKAIIKHNNEFFSVSGSYEYDIEYDNWEEDEEEDEEYVKCVRVDKKGEEYYEELLNLKNKYDI